MDTITTILPAFYQKLSIKIEESSSYIAGLNHTQDLQIDIENVKKRTDDAGGMFIALENHSTRHSNGASVLSVGNLLPLGQRETLQQDEIEVYEYHLRNSNMI